MENGMKKRDVPKFRGDKQQISRTKRDAERDKGNYIFIIDIGGKKICCYRTEKSAE